MNGESKGQQPEALRSLEAAAESGSKKPDDQGLAATPKTRPARAQPESEEKVASDILKAGANQDVKGMADAAKKAPPR